MTPRRDPTLVSVVVIGRNEGERLRRCLTSVAAMTVAGFRMETIYVDSGSGDGSVAVAASLGAAAIALQSSRPTAALGRNAGWRAAQGEFILFLDGDTVLDQNFVAQSLDAFHDSAVAVVWGHRRELYPEHSIFNRTLDLDWIYAPGRTAFCGGDALFRRSVLAATGGFDETLIAGEEPELCRRIVAAGGMILHVDRPMTGHDLAMTEWSQYWKRATRAGHAFAEVAERFAGTENPFWSAETRQNRTRALVLLAIPTVAVLLAVALGRWWPLVTAGFLLAALILRTAWKARWKTRSVVTLLLYGIHSHLQQIPIFLGQLRYRRNRRAGRRTALVEYKS